MLDQHAAAMWRSTLDRCSENCDLTTPAGLADFTRATDDATRALPLTVLQDIARSVGAIDRGSSESAARQAIIRNYVAAATGRGTDRDVDANTHCMMCRARYEQIPATELDSSFPAASKAINRCTDRKCGRWRFVHNPEHALSLEEMAVAMADTPPWRESCAERLARRIAPSGWYRSRTAPTLPRAIGDRCYLEWHSLDVIDLPADVAALVRLDLLPWLRWRIAFAGWQLADRSRRSAGRLETACAELARRACLAEATAREQKDGQI